MNSQFEKRKRTVYALISDPIYKPMKIKEMAMLLGVKKEDKEELLDILKVLEEEKKIHRAKTGRYMNGKAKVISGIYKANHKGFGFVVTEDENEADIYISQGDSLNAMNGDEVEVTILAKGAGRKAEGKIIRIINRATDRIIGRYQKRPNKGYGFVLPDNQKLDRDVFIPEGKDKGAKDGDKVVVRLKSFGTQSMSPEGEIIENIGHIGEPGVDIVSIIKEYKLPEAFKERILNQGERVNKPVSDVDRNGRKDFRALTCITIDGEDAKDLDDAITLRKEGGIYQLGVHIADVTNYVQENSALDREAFERGTSVYLVDRVIPMLPSDSLSNGICSLNQGEDRLTLSCIMNINEKGDIVSHEICESVVCVTQRMSYHQVQNILLHLDTRPQKVKDEIRTMLFQMRDLSAVLRKKRSSRGSIDFDFPETKIVLNDLGKPVDIIPYERNTATKIIEDFMLLANETVAEEYYWLELPFLYRTHDKPEDEKIKTLSTFINNFGYTMRVGNNEIRPKELQKLLGKIEGSEKEILISRLVLRSMKQAKYTTENTGHFGLAAKYYTHFTSPIRRYPDLQIHRIIKDNLRGRLTQDRISHYEKILPEIAKHSSEMERRAEEAERETLKLKKAEYMQERIKERYEGVVSSITKWGIYVELPNGIEGLVHVSNMTDDHYEYNEERYEMIGEHTGSIYHLGQKVEVEVLDADTLLRTIDFKLIKDKAGEK